MLGEGVAERGKGWGQEGWGRGWGNDGGGEGGVEGGWGEALIEVLNENRYRYIQFSYQNAYYEMKSAEIAILGGVSPIFGRKSPCNDIMFSEKHHVLASKTRRREISPNYLCKKEQPYWKTEKLPHFELLNLNISLMNGRQVLIF